MSDITEKSFSPNINAMRPSGIDLIYDYWTPDHIGEKKNLYFHSLRVLDFPKTNESGEILEEVKSLECAIFIERVGDSWRTIVNGSSRLVTAIRRNKIEAKDPIQVVYNGKQRNQSNSHSSDTWSMYRLTQ